MGTDFLIKLRDKVLTRTCAPRVQLASDVYSAVSPFQSQTGGGAVTVSSFLYTENQVPVEYWE